MSQQQQPEALSPSAEKRATLLIYSASFSYMITLGATLILVPLYALHLGFQLNELGVIVGSQAVFGLFLRLFAGAICDRFGERYVLWGSFGTSIVGAVIFGLSTTFWPLILAQTFLGISRALYWTSTQSYGSRINHAKAGTLLGRISSSGTAGQMVGGLTAGAMAEGLGYGWAWAAVVAITTAGLLGALGLPLLPRKQTTRGFKQAWAPIPGIARNPSMNLAGFTSFAASTSMTMAVILLVPYLKAIGNGETVVGAVRTVGSVGSVLIGVNFGRIVARTGQRNLYAIVLTLEGLTLLAVPLVGEGLLLLTLIMFSYGTLHGVLGPMYPLTAATFSTQEQRGMAMAYVGLYWAVAQIVAPLAFGVIADLTSLRQSFWFAGAMFLVMAALMLVLFPLLTRSRRQATEAPA